MAVETPGLECSRRDGAPESPQRSRHRRFTHIAVLFLVFATASAVRIFRLGEPPLDFHPTRQYLSALQARRIYFEHTPSVPEWRRVLAVQNGSQHYEFPLLQSLAAVGYWLHGGETLVIPRLMSVLAWLLGGVLAYRTARHLASPGAALVATAFFLLCPFGVAASRSFQPDPLMVTFLLLSYLTLLRYGERGGAWSLLAAAASGGLATLVKPMAVFQVVGGFVAVWAVRRRRAGGATLRALAAFALVVIALGGGYYLYDWFSASGLTNYAQQVFLPHLLITGAFWKGWLAQIWKVVGFVAPVGAVLGFVVMPKGVPRALLGGLAGGYAAYVLVFNYTGFTHDYYHLQLIPLVTLALASLADRLIVRLDGVRLSGVVSGEALLAVLFVTAVLDVAVLSYYRERSASFAGEAATYREVGELVGHGTKNVLLANYYALPLKFYGEIGGTYWPHSFDARHEELMGLPTHGAEERLKTIIAGSEARYFIVTNLPELHSQPDLERLMAANFSVLAATDRYVIYDLETRPPGTDTPPHPPQH
jgi:4-amino-4-deoxy-L-arabinose transferase-like glycosyltransferase